MSATPKTASAVTPELEARFHQLAKQWLDETMVSSSTIDRREHPAFKEIVGMGEAVIRLVLREMGKDRGHWDLAMSEITGERPYPASAAGRITLIEQFWLVWGVERGYLPRSPYPSVSYPPPPKSETPEQRFERLADRWIDETAVLSSTTDTVAHPAFQEIVSMGEAVIPLVLRRMEKADGHWDLAMSRITKERPFTEAEVGKIRLMEAAWFRWAREKGYAW